MRTNLRLSTPALAVLCLAFAATGAGAAEIFSLKSTTFEDGRIMPKKVANSKANQPNNANCVGDNVSPQFSWINPPDGTKSFVLMMFDPEGRAPSGVSHWVAYGIPADVTGFAEGEVSKESKKYVGGTSLMKLPHYFGPCTPPGPLHHYTLTLMATDLEPTALAAGLDRAEAMKALDGHVLQATGLIGTFSKP
jgi:Raf kinase inhibitor-like YbhB/YbcL family protein